MAPVVTIHVILPKAKLAYASAEHVGGARVAETEVVFRDRRYRIEFGRDQDKRASRMVNPPESLTPYAQHYPEGGAPAGSG